MTSCVAQDKFSIKTIKGDEISTETLTTKIDSVLKANSIPGLSIAIINDAEIVYQNTFGVTNIQTQQPVTDKTIFEGASLSKPIFAYFTMKLVEKGVISLDVPLYTYLEHLNISEASKENYKRITARMVLSHRTGFPNHAFGKEISLAFKPGTDFRYSGEAFQYLAEVIAKLNDVDCKQELNSLFQEEVTQPLHMPYSTFVWNDYIAKHKAYGHDEKGQPTKNKPRPTGWDGNTFNSYSSLHSNASEYAQFLIALLKSKGLSNETLAEMLTEHTQFKDDNPLKQQIGQTGWGLGMAQKPTKYGKMHMHTGNNHDFQSYMMILPEKDFGIVFFTNSDKAIPFIQGLNVIMGPVF